MDEDVVFRAPMRSRLDEVDALATVEHALASGVCGVGGRLPRPPVGLPAAVAAVRRDHGERVADRLERFARVPDGALVWTRRGEDLFVGRLIGGWRYDAAARAHELDLPHVRPCAWTTRPVPPTDVPAAVVATFRRSGRNFQRIHDPAVAAGSVRAWAAAGGRLRDG